MGRPAGRPRLRRAGGAAAVCQGPVHRHRLPGPNHPVRGDQLRFSISLDDAAPEVKNGTIRFTPTKRNIPE